MKIFSASSPSHKIIERKEAGGIKKIWQLLKFRAKIAIKNLLCLKVHLPARVLSFHQLRSFKKHKSSNILNRFEDMSGFLIVEDPVMVRYVEPKFFGINIIGIEGESGRPYRISKTHITKTPSIFCYMLQNAQIVGDQGYIVDTAQEVFISETMGRWFAWDERIPLSYLSSFRKKEVVHLSGVSLSIARPGSDNYYHFLLESLPKLLLIKRKYKDVEFDNIIISGEGGRNRLAWLQQAGVDLSKVIFTNYGSLYQCEQLVFVSEISYQYSPSPIALDLLLEISDKSFIEDAKKPQFQIVVASRGDASNRNVTWEEDLVRKFDAKIIRFSELSPLETIHACRSCDCIIGAHGAALSNIVFCRPGTSVIECIFGLDHAVYGRISSVRSLNHYIVNADDVDGIISCVEYVIKRGPVSYLNNRSD